MKRYLTGIDWLINAIDYTSKAQSKIGNHSQVVLELKNPPDHQTLITTLNNFTQKFSQLNGYPSRAINLCPYWKTPTAKNNLSLRIDILKLDHISQYLLPLAAQVNAAFKNGREHLVFTLLEAGKLTFLALTFDHRILDAKGAEAFLNLFQQDYQKKGALPISQVLSAHLDHWKEKFLAGKQLNRFLLKLTEEAPRILPFNPQTEPCKFKIIHLNSQQTQNLTNKAYAQAGYLMFMPHLLTKSIQIMHRIFLENNIEGLNYLIPVPLEMRHQDQTENETLFNHFSFLLFKIKADLVGNTAILLAEIKNQMYEQVKNKIPQAIINASFLLRIAPLPVANFFLKLMSKKHFASFSFSYLSNAYQPNKFMQEEIINIFHLPRTPKPPGIGIFFNQFEDKLNITLSYYDDLLTDQQLVQITKSLQELGNE